MQCHPMLCRVRISVNNYVSPGTLSVKKPVKSDQFFSGDKYFYPTNNFTRLKLRPISCFFSWIKAK